MNNIEILEEFIKYFEAEATQRKYRRNISITVGEDDIEAIENLIQENKELKKENEKLTYARNWYFEHFTSQACTPEQLHKILRFDYIPKSKVKEKIEELDKRKQDLLQLPDDCARTLGLEDCDEKIILYKELLEGE